MRCRRTKLSIIYSIMDKNKQTLIKLLKRHCPPGSIVFSDSHMSYCNLNTGISKLSQYGWYHMWTNHAIRMVHEKFPFNHTLNVERSWASIKRVCYKIRFAKKYEKIQQYCDEFMMRKTVIRKSRLHDFMMRVCHDYYVDKLVEFKVLQKF